MYFVATLSLQRLLMMLPLLIRSLCLWCWIVIITLIFHWQSLRWPECEGWRCMSISITLCNGVSTTPG